MRILYLEDSKISVKILSNILEGYGEIVHSPSLKKAQEELAKQNFSCIILAYRCIDGNGIEFARTIRQNKEYHKIPILLLSSYLTSELTYKAMKAGINHCIAKPINQEIKQIIANQVKSPTIEIIKRSDISVCCVEWESGGSYFQFSPDLEKVVQAGSRKKAALKMSKILQKSYDADNSTIKDIIETKPVFHLIRGGKK